MMTDEEVVACVDEMRQQHRILEVAWIILIRKNAPDGATAGQVNMVRRAFFDGARAAFDIMRMAASSGDEDVAQMLLDDAQKELAKEAKLARKTRAN